jgi:hypothetical protein
MRRYEQPNRHAAERERKRRKARYGMRVVGASARLLARLSERRAPKARASRKRTLSP